MSVDYTILGSGVAGLCQAAEFHRRGATIRVVDPNGAPGKHACSWWAGGMLAPESESTVAEDVVTHHGRGAADWWISNGAGIHHQGTLVIALNRDQNELTTFSRRLEGAIWLNNKQLAELEPHLADHFEHALYIKGEAHLNPRASLIKLHEQLQQHGVEFTDSDQPEGQIIDCRGFAARDHLSDLRGVKGEMAIIECHEVRLQRPVRLLHPRFPLYIVPRGNGRFMLGATQIESSKRHRPTVRSIVELLNAAYALHSAFAEAELIEFGVDVRPAFPDNLPRIRHKKDRVYINGLFRHGFMLAPALAHLNADLLLENKPPEDFYEDHR